MYKIYIRKHTDTVELHKYSLHSAIETASDILLWSLGMPGNKPDAITVRHDNKTIFTITL